MLDAELIRDAIRNKDKWGKLAAEGGLGEWEKTEEGLVQAIGYCTTQNGKAMGFVELGRFYNLSRQPRATITLKSQIQELKVASGVERARGIWEVVLALGPVLLVVENAPDWPECLKWAQGVLNNYTGSGFDKGFLAQMTEQVNVLKEMSQNPELVKDRQAMEKLELQVLLE